MQTNATRAKTVAQHADILNAYMTRIKIADLEQLLELRKQASHAQLNLGMNAQIKLHDQLQDLAQASVNNLLSHDLVNIEHFIEKNS